MLFGKRRLKKLKKRIERNERSILIIKDCCRMFSDEILDLKDYMVDQQEQINELRKLLEKGR